MQLTIQHQARELLHGIDLLLQCMSLPSATTLERRRWRSQVSQSRKELEALYAAGLRRDFADQDRGGVARISVTTGWEPAASAMAQPTA